MSAVFVSFILKNFLSENCAHQNNKVEQSWKASVTLQQEYENMLRR
jgi:hypothetical protein